MSLLRWFWFGRKKTAPTPTPEPPPTGLGGFPPIPRPVPIFGTVVLQLARIQSRVRGLMRPAVALLETSGVRAEIRGAMVPAPSGGHVEYRLGAITVSVGGFVDLPRRR